MYLYRRSAFIYNKALQTVYVGVTIKHFKSVVAITFIIL